MRGNCIVAQSGGSTAVINASACGVIQEAMKHSEIEAIYGAHNGILGILDERIFDLRKEDPANIEGLKVTPSSALGTCRYKVKKQEDFKKILEVFKKHNIRYFFYIGGNDSRDTADKVNKLAKTEGYNLNVLGIPKTVDNDLAFTDHCPGYGSVIKYLATMTMESGLDTEASYTSDKVNVIETIGRNAGWIAAGTSLARRDEKEAPHIIIFPEIPFDKEAFKERVDYFLSKISRTVIVVSEGARNPDGSYVAEIKGDFAKDSFGHIQLGGTAVFIKELVECEIKVKTRYCMPSIVARNGSRFASLTDSQEAYSVGQKSVQLALEGITGKMVTLERINNEPYQCRTGLADLSDVANGEKLLPREWIGDDDFSVRDEFIKYARPLIQGEVSPPIKDGLPVYTRLKKFFIG